MPSQKRDVEQPDDGECSCSGRLEAAGERRPRHYDWNADHKGPRRPPDSPVDGKLVDERPDCTADRCADAVTPDRRNQDPAVETETDGEREDEVNADEGLHPSRNSRLSPFSMPRELPRLRQRALT